MVGIRFRLNNTLHYLLLFIGSSGILIVYETCIRYMVKNLVDSKKIHVPYVYKWVHISTLQWYVGVRYAIRCHPNDGYICSSLTVRPRILKSPTEWIRQIVATGSVNDMRSLEKEILDMFYDRSDVRCLNRNKADAPPILTGDGNPMYGRHVAIETRLKISTSKKKSFVDNPGSLERLVLHLRQMAKDKKGTPRKPHSQSTREKIRLSVKSDKVAVDRCIFNAAAQKGIPNRPLCKPVVGTPMDAGLPILRFVSAGDAGRNGFASSKVLLCIHGKRPHHKRYTWRLATDSEILEYFP